MRILLIEDEERIARSVKKGLEQEYYTVDLAQDGQIGYDLASSEKYDLIILDLMLPFIDGLTVCKQLREQHISTPILVLTAKGQLKDKVTGLDAGADDYLLKPFAFEELLARIRALSRRPPTNTEKILQIRDLRVDETRYTVTRGDTVIQLSKREYALLVYLVKHPGIIFSKDQLMSHVWEYDSEILPNTIEVYIKNLRKKIDQPFHNKKNLIQTVRGFGYKIE